MKLVMGLINRCFLILIIISLSGCVANYKKIAQRTTKDSLKYGLSEKVYQTQNFKIYTLQRITDINKNVRIYLEGDGKVFVRNGVLSPNPTPTSYFLTQLITQDNSTNVVYIARPCQFVEDKECYGDNQSEKYWTNARFSKEVIESINEVVKEFSNFNIEFVGYSGGATIMKYVAYESQKNYQNVESLRSVVGNLENKEFSKIHQMSVANENFANDAEVYEVLKDIPQIHFVGGDDKVVPKIISQSYVKKLPHKNCAKILTISGVSHGAGWFEVWKDLVGIKPSCNIKIEDIIKTESVEDSANGAVVGGVIDPETANITKVNEEMKVKEIKSIKSTKKKHKKKSNKKKSKKQHR